MSFAEMTDNQQSSTLTPADFTKKDKIAVPTVKVSTQAIVLQMAAAKEFGQAEYTRLDKLTVSLSHPDGMSMLLVEQNYELATAISDRVVILGKGKVRWQGSCRDLAVEHAVRETWLGV